jgi:hypothetical protein
MKLTARQINCFDELERDRRAFDASLEVALNFHAMQRNELAKREKDAWAMLSEAHGFDLNVPGGWKLAHLDGTVCVVRAED